ncbi:glycosyl hydrolase 115 family protein [Olivibacter sp. CPCC 100613]|uniref:glycosyl hydrolase 115 family protein n=1 Tax=Olivibacter sp. CPCC 100613 TaxID=3079931 RepID=UPI002FF6773C
MMKINNLTTVRSIFRFLVLMGLMLQMNPLVMAATTDVPVYVDFAEQPGYLPLVEGANTIPIVRGENEAEAVVWAIDQLRQDFEKVTGVKPTAAHNQVPKGSKTLLLIGTLGQNPLIDQLVKQKKIDVSAIHGQWEASLTQTIDNPLPGVEKALLIVGSDRRGTIYGIYELSKQMGVSPWYWWADVPIQRHPAVYARSIRAISRPKVKYRGIFLNDEAPALSGWAKEKFGGFNHEFYKHVFELILRLKGNYLWPAMWGSAFYDDDPENAIWADRMGVVMGTSHHEPLTRAHDEWRRYGEGPWDYQKNEENLRNFWRDGIRRMGARESLVTIGMRGDGDEPMSEENNIQLLERIVNDQRKIIGKETGKAAKETPQLWALYKEVQDYYDRGMRVPDDVTLLLCDDNWGNIRKLPDLTAKKRSGGYGIYYHFDYVGGPRNSKWINVSQVQRVWEQMNLAYQYGVDQIWIVNVGDLKPMEYPISFFLDMAWNPDQFKASNLLQHTEAWCAQQFGEQYAKESARLINTYTKYNHRVTPELLDENTYSLQHYGEFEQVVMDYRNLLIDAMRLYYILPQQYRDAFDELVLFPINACSNLYEMYYAVAKNKYFASKNDEQANYWADKVKACFERDSILTVHYNKDIANGKWSHMMDQVRIGYKIWQEPRKSTMPHVSYLPTMKPMPKIFMEVEGYVSMEAENYDASSGGGGVSWTVIPDLGKTLSGVTTSPVTKTPDEQVYLEYKVDLRTTGEVKLVILTSPSLNFNANKGLRYAVSIDGGAEQEVNINGHYRGELGEWQAKRIIETATTHLIEKPGLHTLRIRPLDPGIVFQKILLDMGGLKPSYLGPPQSEYKRR